MLESLTALPSTSKLTLNSLPDDAIYSIIKQIKSSNEVQKLKGVSKRFRRIIHNRSYKLARPKVDSLIISFDFPKIAPTQIGKFRPASSPSTVTFNINVTKVNRPNPLEQASHATADMECPKKLSSTMLASLSATLKKFSMNSTLEFHRINIDETFVKQFLRPIADIKNVEILKFCYCTFDVTVETMIELLNQTKCKQLEVIYCNGSQKIVNDTLLTSINSIDIFRIQTPPTQSRFNVTNKTLLHWISTYLPATVDFCNCQTLLTPSNLSTFLNFAYCNLKKAPKQALFDFGYISAHPSDVKQFFILNNCFKYNYSYNPNGTSIQFQSSLSNRFDGFETPELAFIMSIMKPNSNLKNSKFVINFVLNCEALRSFEPKILQRSYNFSNIDKKFKVVSY